MLVRHAELELAAARATLARVLDARDFHLVEQAAQRVSTMAARLVEVTRREVAPTQPQEWAGDTDRGIPDSVLLAHYGPRIIRTIVDDSPF